MLIKGRDVAGVLKTTWREMGEDKISVYAAQMAYAFFFSLFPLLLFFAALFNLVADKQTVQTWFDTRLVGALPRDVAGLLGTTIQKVVFAENAPGILSFGLLTAAWSGSGVFGALRGALNDAYDSPETRPWWKQYGLQLGMLGLAGVVLLASTVILLNGEGVMAWLGDRLRLGPVTTFLWTVLQFPLAIGGVVAVLWLIYFFLPNCTHQGKLVVLLGSIAATLLWLVATLLFRLYVQKFNQLNPAYGAIGAIMVLLTWMYYSSYVLLAIGELISVVEKSKDRAAAPNDAPIPREHALVPVGASPRRVAEPRRAGRTSSNGDGRWRRPMRHMGLFRVVERVEASVDGVRRWLEGAAARLREDVAVARDEVGQVARGVAVGSATMAAAAAVGLLGAMSLLTGVILLVGDQWLPSDLFWVAALIVVLVTGSLAFWMGRRGGAEIAEAVTARETVETLAETMAD